jgi:aspartate racemase
MKPKPIGILGGAGPLAGALLLERVFSLSGSLYGCQRDSDFPKVFLLSFPFSEMLSPKMDVSLLRKELKECLDQLRRNGSEVISIACNTLHAFLDTQQPSIDLIHLPREVANAIPTDETPLVLCTSTSVQFEVHRHFFPCTYPESRVQKEIDSVIDQTLKGINRRIILKQLLAILNSQKAGIIVLGCTELSLFAKHLLLKNKIIIDPLEIAAKKLLKISFNK